MELALPELNVGGRLIPLAGTACHLDVLLAADQPDRLEASFSGRSLPASLAEAGETVLFRLRDRERFRGRVTRLVTSVDSCRVSTVGFTAHPEWFGLAAALSREEEYFHVTDAEVAARIADALRLEGRIDPTHQLHARLLRQGKPWEFLRARALVSGRIAAISGGRLFFTRGFPGGTPVWEIGPQSKVLSLRASRYANGRSGWISLRGDPGISPLDRLRLQGFDSACDGFYRAAQVRIRFQRRWISSEVLWQEEGWNLARTSCEEARRIGEFLEASK